MLPIFSWMTENKIQNFSIFYLHIFKCNKNYEGTACHQQTSLKIMYSVTSGKPSYGTIPIKLKKRKVNTSLYSFIHTYKYSSI